MMRAVLADLVRLLRRERAVLQHLRTAILSQLQREP